MLVQLGHLQLEILDGEVDVGTPRLELCSRRSERILQRLENFIFGEFYIWGGSLPPPCRAAGPLPPTGGAAGDLPPGRGAAGSLQGPMRKINLFLFTYKSLPPPCRAVGPLPPPCRAVGVQNCKT